MRLVSFQSLASAIPSVFYIDAEIILSFPFTVHHKASLMRLALCKRARFSVNTVIRTIL